MDEALIPGLSLNKSRDVIQILAVDPTIVSNVWPHFEPRLLEVRDLWKDYHTLKTIFEGLCNRSLQLWAVNDTNEFYLFMMTDIRKFPLTTVMNMWLICGEDLIESVPFLLDAIESVVKQSGVDRVSITGRKGWKKILRDFGYEEQGIVLMKKLTPIQEH